MIKSDEQPDCDSSEENQINQNSKKNQIEQQVESNNKNESFIQKISPSSEFECQLLRQHQLLRGSPSQRDRILLNRLTKYYSRDQHAQFNLKQHYFCSKRQPIYLKDVIPIQNEIILFGTDLMKKSHIIEKFNPTQLQCIDLSHWKLYYHDYFGALHALRRNQRYQVEENRIKLEQDCQRATRKWLEMKPYYYNGTYQRRLLARFATSDEKIITHIDTNKSQMPFIAKKVYELRKKLSNDIQENFRLRSQNLSQQRMERRSHYNRSNNQNYEGSNYQTTRNNNNNLANKKQIKRSETNQRERSRQRDFDNNVSVKSKSSFKSLIGNIGNINLDDNISCVSDLSFILQKDPDFQRQIIQRFNHQISLNENDNTSVILGPNNQELLQQRNASIQFMYNSYRLTQNMPTQRSFSLHNASFSRRNQSFNYSQYIEQQELQEQRKRKQNIQVIQIIDD